MSGPKPGLVYLPTGEVETDRLLYIKSPSDQFEERISVPLDISELTSVDMYDIVSKNPSSFAVRFN